MKKTTKLLVLLLSVALVLTGVIVAVSAATDSGNVAKVGDTEYATLAAAIGAADSNSTVTLIADASIADCNINKNVTVDLNGYTITSNGGTNGTAFLLDSGADLNIVGDGAINVDGRLAYSGSNNAALNVKGDLAGIDIVHSGTKNQNVIYAKGGSFTFTNVDIVATPNKGYAFNMSDGSGASFEFNAVTIDTRGSTTVQQTSGVMYVSRLGTVAMDHCTVETNGAFINFQVDAASYDTTVDQPYPLKATELATDRYVVINDCYVSAINTNVKTPLFGSYSYINANIYVTDSYLESSYRALMVKDMGLGELILDNSYFVLDNCNPMEANSNVMRSGSIRVKEGASIVVDKTADVVKDSSGKAKSGAWSLVNSAPARIYLEEGARVNHEVFTFLTTLTQSGDYYVAKNENYVYFVEYDEEGTETYVSPSASTKYTFVYDPIGDTTSPYVVTKIGEGAVALYTKDDDGNITSATANTVSDHKSLSDYVFFHHDGATRAGQFNQYETINGAKKYIGHGTKYVNGNATYYYAPNGYIYNDGTIDKAINFWIGLKTGISETDLDVFVYEFDLGTNSADGFAPGYVALNSRTGANNDGSGSSLQFFHVASDGTVTSSTIHNFTGGYKLDTNKWNRVSVVVETATTKGRAHVFIDGNYLGYANAYGQDNAYLYAPRFDSTVKSRDVIGPVTLFDNVGIRVFGDGTGAESVKGEADARAYLTNNGMPWNTCNTQTRVNGAITVGGIGYSDIDSAVKAAAALGTVAQLNADVTEPQTVTESCKISANGYTITTSDDSLACIQVKDENGNTVYYEFDEKYKGEITVHWSVGNIFTGEYEDVTTVAKTGTVVSYAYNKDRWIYNDAEQKIYKQIGWNGIDTEHPLSYEFIQQIMNGESAGHVYVTPEIESYDMAQVVLDASGNLVAATESTNVTPGSIFYNFAKDQTYKLYKDCLMSSELGSGARNFENGTFNIDLNGHTLTIAQKALSFVIKANTTLNVYSSAPGGMIYRPGEADGSSVRGNALFHMAPIGDATAKEKEENVTGNVHNSVLNIGTIEGISGSVGSYLTVTGDCVIEPRTGDESCYVNVDGATLIRQGQAYGALVYPRFFNGTITIKNATLINTSNNYILSDPSAYVSAVSFKYSTTATLEGCTLIQKTPTDAIIGATTSFDSITLKDCVISGHIYETKGNTVDTSKITLLSGIAVTTAPGNYTEDAWANYNVGFTSDEIANLFGENGYYLTKRLSVSDGKLVETDLYIVRKGFDTSTLPENAEVAVLDTLKYMNVLDQETVTVTWNDLDGAQVKEEVYIKGGNVADCGVEIPESTTGLRATKKIFKSWGELPANIQDNIEINPAFDVKANVKGLQYNLSLYTDFVVNLYIPKDLGGYVKVYSDEAKTDELTFEDVTVDGLEYVKVNVGQLCNKPSENVTFYLAIEEAVGETVYLADKAISVSITEYANAILESENGDYTLNDKVLVYYMLKYVNEAAKYFNGDYDSAAEELIRTYYSVGVSYNKDITYSGVNEGLSEVFEGASIQLTSSPAFIINLKEGFVGAVTVSYGTQTRTFTNFVNTATDANNRSIVVNGMKVNNFRTELSITAEGTLNGTAVTVSGRYNLDSYVEYAEANGLQCLELVKALCTYADIASEYKLDTLGDNVVDYGKMIIDSPDFVYTNFSKKDITVTFTKPEYAEEVVYTVSDERVKVENGKIYAVGELDGEIEVTVVATTSKHRGTFKITVKSFTPDQNQSLIDRECAKYEADGAILSTVKPNGTIFIGDSYCTLGYWKDFYTDFADEDAYLLGIGGSRVDDWFVCSDRLVYGLNPSEIIMHIGFNDVYGSSAYLAPEVVGELIVELLSIYHEKFPDAKIYYCSVESSKWSNNYEKSFNDSVILNSVVSEFAETTDWLTFVNTRPIFCDDENKVVYTDGDGNSTDDDDTGIYGVGSHPSIYSYDEYKKIIDAARGKTTEEESNEA